MAVINIIGNGFDRAHGLKTSYGDFIKDLVIRSINYDDKVRSELFNVGFIPSENQSYDYIKSNFRNLVNNKLIVFKNQFLRILMDKYFEADWIDIEIYYFEYLKNIKSDNISFVKDLHKEFNQIKNYLEKYLKEQTSQDDTAIEEYIELLKYDKHQNNLFLSFNYTNTLDKYLPKLKLKTPSFNFDTIQIHGKLFDESNPIIFGYGDENDDYYRIRGYDNEFILFHKTHIYPLKTNKRKLLNYLNESKNIQVNIFGHSCGVSDRVLLRQIFEHENVETIKLYYHEYSDGNNFQNVSSNIFKTLNDNSIIDSKLVPMSNCVPMLQITDKSS